MKKREIYSQGQKIIIDFRFELSQYYKRELK